MPEELKKKRYELAKGFYENNKATLKETEYFGLGFELCYELMQEREAKLIEALRFYIKCSEYELISDSGDIATKTLKDIGL